jgi:hypothetical protein
MRTKMQLRATVNLSGNYGMVALCGYGFAGFAGACCVGVLDCGWD